jgi:hypothetical protein
MVLKGCLNIVASIYIYIEGNKKLRPENRSKNNKKVNE